ncbi:hypothetical protein [Kribbella sp. NPDC055071]
MRKRILILAVAACAVISAGQAHPTPAAAVTQHVSADYPTEDHCVVAKRQMSEAGYHVSPAWYDDECERDAKGYFFYWDE